MEEKTTDQGVTRRQFAKGAMGGLGLAMGSALNLSEAVAKAVEDENKVQEKRKKLVTTVGNPILVDDKKYKRFSGSNIAFNALSRDIGDSCWGPYMEQFEKNLKAGKGGKDIEIGTYAEARSINALENALMAGNYLTGAHGEGHENRGPLAWDNHISSEGLAQLPPSENNPDILAHQVKIAARLGGADLVGIAKLNHHWVYAETQRNTYSPEKPETKPIVFRAVDKPMETETELIIPETVTHAIVMAVEMPRAMNQSSPGPTGACADAIGYSRMGYASLALAEFIRAQGYTAIPCKNDTALSVPLAIEAGLGEAGRLGALITPEFGPCVRLCKVLTDMPLTLDQPIKFGVEEFCNYCKKCARECPSKCITEGEQTWGPVNECNNSGVKKWYNDYKKCLSYWGENGMSCTNCVAVCPFTKGAMWAHGFTEWCIKHVKASHPVWLHLDDAFGYGRRRDDKQVWDLDITTFGKDRQKA